ncbi:MAG: flagellar biosynthesis anti-sigma factor FlgM [Spirochaetales bacterium]|nr:flagellar biosynthesis anti-sigma factor FlgM [Spirochaetales bacterium]
MTIDSIGPVDPLSKINRSSRSPKTAPASRGDAVQLSSEARNMSEIYRITEEVRLSPDVRQDRIDEIKAKLLDPNYINDTILNATAENIMKAFGLS